MKRRRRRTGRLIPMGDWRGTIHHIRYEKGFREPTVVYVMMNDGTMARYDLHIDQPPPMFTECIEIIRQWTKEDG